VTLSSIILIKRSNMLAKANRSPKMKKKMKGREEVNIAPQGNSTLILLNFYHPSACWRNYLAVRRKKKKREKKREEKCARGSLLSLG